MAATACLAVLSISGWALVHLVYQPYSCIGEATRLARTTALLPEARGFEQVLRARQNAARAREIIDRCPLGIRPYMILARNEYVLGQYAGAVATLDRALMIEQRPELYVARGDAFLAAGRVEDAIRDYAIAQRFGPTHFQTKDPEIRERTRRLVQHGSP